MSITLNTWSTNFDKNNLNSGATDSTSKDNMLNIDEFLAANSDLGIDEGTLRMIFAMNAGADGKLSQAEYEEAKALADAVFAEFSASGGLLDVPTFINKVLLRMGFSQAQIDKLMLSFNSADLGQTMSASARMNQIMLIVSQMIKMVGKFQETQEKAADLRG